MTQEMKSCEAVLKARCKALPLWSEKPATKGYELFTVADLAAESVS